MNAMDTIIPAMIFSMIMSMGVYIWMWTKSSHKDEDPTIGLRYISIIGAVHAVIGIAAIFFCANYC